VKQTYSGGCQCGKVRYEASFELGEVVSCSPKVITFDGRSV
jgi:hypothetical protein